MSRLRGQLRSWTLNPGVERCRNNDPLRCATTRPDRSLLQSLKSVATTCVRTVIKVCNDRTLQDQYGCQRGVCNLLSNHLSSFMRGASGADLPALPATKTVYGCSQRSISVEVLHMTRGSRQTNAPIGVCPAPPTYLPRRRRKGEWDGARRECPISASIKARAASPMVGERSGRHFVVRPGPCHRRASSLSSPSVARAKVKRPFTNRRSTSCSPP